MEIYTVEPTTNTVTALVENFDSCIWTERYSSYGDFSLTMAPNPALANFLLPDKFLGFGSSDATMIIESVLTKTEDDGRQVMTVEGTSLEGFLRHRVAIGLLDNHWTVLRGSIGSILHQLLTRVLVDGGVSSQTNALTYDVFTNLSISSIYTGLPDAIMTIKRQDLYTAVKEVLDAYDLGFSFKMPNRGSTNKYIQIYKGVDRTSISGVSFSAENDSLTKVSRLLSKENQKTTAYVYTSGTTKTAVLGGGSSLREWRRKVISVDATDLPEPAAGQPDERVEQMTARGLELLGQRKPVDLLDGEVNPQTSLRFGVDYGLGDLVTLKMPQTSDQLMRVAEHIWIQDAEGEQSYPTLTFA